MKGRHEYRNLDGSAQVIDLEEARAERITAALGPARFASVELEPGTGFVLALGHRVPVVEGGGSCGLDNLRTLCVACHRRATRELAARRAERRRAEKAGAA